MRIARIIGHVTLNRAHPALAGARLRLASPLTCEQLLSDSPLGDETIVVWDELAAGQDSLIGVCEGPEASQPFRPDIKPIDAYAALLLDQAVLNFDQQP